MLYYANDESWNSLGVVGSNIRGPAHSACSGTILFPDTVSALVYRLVRFISTVTL
jgi:hypothetical protein